MRWVVIAALAVGCGKSETPAPAAAKAEASADQVPPVDPIPAKRVDPRDKVKVSELTAFHFAANDGTIQLKVDGSVTNTHTKAITRLVLHVEYLNVKNKVLKDGPVRVVDPDSLDPEIDNPIPPGKTRAFVCGGERPEFMHHAKAIVESVEFAK